MKVKHTQRTNIPVFSILVLQLFPSSFMAAPTSLLVLLYLPALHNAYADNDVSRHTQLREKKALQHFQIDVW